jgi:outer membrane protein assembly factor BamB
MNLKLEKKYTKNFQHEITASAALENELLISLKTGEFVFLDINSDGYSEKRRIHFEGVGPVYKMAYRNHLIYFAGADAKFYCMNMEGTIIWVHEFQNAISEFFFSNLGLDNREFVLICAYDKTFRVLDTQTGAYHWAQMAGLGIEYAAIGYNSEGKIDAVFICSDEGTVRKLNPKNGEMTAYFESAKVIRTIIADFQNQCVYAGGDEMVLYILDYQKLTIKNKLQFDTYIWDLLKFNDKLIVQLYNFAFLGEILEETGDPGLVYYEINNQSQSLNEIKRVMKFNIQCKSVVDGLLFSGTTDGQIIVVNLDSLTILASEKIGAFINSISVIKSVHKEKNKWKMFTCEENGDFKVIECSITDEQT